MEERPLLIHVAGREVDEISMTGEKLSLEQFELALSSVGLNSSSLEESKVVVWVEAGDKPHLVWGIPESLFPSPAASISELVTRLDAALCRFNIHYEEALMIEKVIAPASAIAVPLQVFENYRKSALGVAQLKPKRLFKSEADFRKIYQWE